MDKSAYITIIRQSGRENAQHPDLLFIDTPRSHIGKEVCISNVLFGSSTHTHTHKRVCTSGFPRFGMWHHFAGGFKHTGFAMNVPVSTS